MYGQIWINLGTNLKLATKSPAGGAGLVSQLYYKKGGKRPFQVVACCHNQARNLDNHLG